MTPTSIPARKNNVMETEGKHFQKKKNRDPRGEDRGRSWRGGKKKSSKNPPSDPRKKKGRKGKERDLVKQKKDRGRGGLSALEHGGKNRLEGGETHLKLKESDAGDAEKNPRLSKGVKTFENWVGG